MISWLSGCLEILDTRPTSIQHPTHTPSQETPPSNPALMSHARNTGSNCGAYGPILSRYTGGPQRP
eukprot:5163798-Pyramimonas_sp.AAC.1